jgi:hypothetical protein
MKELSKQFTETNFVRTFGIPGVLIFVLIIGFIYMDEKPLMWIIAGVFSIPIIACLFPFFFNKFRFGKFIEKFDDDGERLEFTENVKLSQKLNIYHSGEYLIDYATLKVVKSSEILWCYGLTRRVNTKKGSMWDKGFVCKTQNRKVYISMKQLREDGFDAIYTFIWLFNPDCVIGYSRESRKAYKKLKKV